MIDKPKKVTENEEFIAPKNEIIDLPSKILRKEFVTKVEKKHHKTRQTCVASRYDPNINLYIHPESDKLFLLLANEKEQVKSNL
jgi:hypothetical protein